MATLGHQIYQRMSALARFIPPDCQPLVADLEDQFARVTGVADGQIRYLEGVIEFYTARSDTKVTIAAERLALIAVLTLQITALSSVYGMNVIVNDRTPPRPARRGAGDHGGHLGGAAALGQATGMVVAVPGTVHRTAAGTRRSRGFPHALCNHPGGSCCQAGLAEHQISIWCSQR